MTHVIRPDEGESRLDARQRNGFRYLLNETIATNGLVADRTQPGAPGEHRRRGLRAGPIPHLAGAESAMTFHSCPKLMRRRAVR